MERLRKAAATQLEGLLGPRRLEARWASSYRKATVSSLFVPTVTKEALAGEPNLCASADLLLRGGFIRQSSSGIYSFLPLGLRVLNKLERIIDEEMQSIGGQKLALPLLLGTHAWKKSGRWKPAGTEMMNIKDRKGTEMILAPTHEEEITQLVASEISSYRQMPLRLYQIGKKYRDELRPRLGLLRGREFIMKDMYSFDVSEQDALTTYDEVRGAYDRILTRIGLPFVSAEADSGEIGGDRSHEYHLISPVGEDTVLTCGNCGYVANEERAVGHIVVPASTSSSRDVVDEAVSQLLVSHRSRLPLDLQALDFSDIKAELALVGESPEQLVIVLLRRGRRMNSIKTKAHSLVADQDLRFVDDRQKHEILQALSTSQGSLRGLTVLVDTSIPTAVSPHGSPSSGLPEQMQGNSSLATGLSQPSFQYAIGDFHNADAGDGCPKCNSSSSNPEHLLKGHRAIEVAHTFYLGTKYSVPLDATYKTESGVREPMQMGCYGIGVSRMVAAIVESSHDNDGIIWPSAVSPYRVCIIPLFQKKNAASNSKLQAGIDQVYDRLSRRFGNDIIIDDRMGLTPGYKIKDSLLVGYSDIVVLGKSWLNDGLVEVQSRRSGEKRVVSLDEMEALLVDTEAVQLQ
ncbi:prolyltRNA synthetase putative [Polychytrium aggregatum]|uniref:prolyltRNA synthetase putative n=1 Tax=Polychytrium aggregatum TaxID=110093 RepID=UPI0022FEA3DD|nr:prolyltRNA synthetase putative [Polychytrium aggregatum]KAI9209729.1 prolyltRNA synthetase putative [Polychytrium aggregatum]